MEQSFCSVVLVLLVFTSVVQLTVSFPPKIISNSYAPSFKYEDVREMIEKDAGDSYQVKFIPEDGIRLREVFERKYGKHGKDLIASFGSGKSPSAMDQYNYEYDEEEYYDDPDDVNMLHMELKKIKGHEETSI